jgi:hypothetical protein
MEVKELRLVKEENSRLKQLAAELSLDRHMLQEIVSHAAVAWKAYGCGYSKSIKALKPAQKKDLVSWLKTCYKVSIRRAWRLVRFRQ